MMSKKQQFGKQKILKLSMIKRADMDNKDLKKNLDIGKAVEMIIHEAGTYSPTKKS